ncbi:carboxylesterase family protein [Saccharopolyspora sp. NPDC002376]
MWALSGATADVLPERAEALTSKIATDLGIDATLAAFTAVDEDRLVEAQKAMTAVGADMLALLDSGLGLGPAIDGDLIVRPTLESIAMGVGADKHLVLGVTDDEFSAGIMGQADQLVEAPLPALLQQYGLSGEASEAYLGANADVVARGNAAMLGRYISDRMFKTSIIRTANARSTALTWVYRFSYRSPSFDAAVHCVDVPFWFDCLDSEVGIPVLAGTNPPASLARATHGAAVALIRDGDPGWAAWSSHEGSTRVFGGPDSTPEVLPDGYAGVRPLL